MVKSHDFVVDLKDIDKEDAAYVGGKNANLGEMIRAGFPVPDGFAITAFAYHEFLKYNKLDEKIRSLLTTVNYNNQASLSQVANHIKKLIVSSEIPQPIIDSIFSFYEKLEKNHKEVLVAIRSSATSEDSKDASFAGQQETFLNIQGEASVIECVRRAWASLFEERALFYRHDQKLDSSRVGISLVVQRMVQSDRSGVIFTVDPISGNKNIITIEAVFGLGEMIVQGKVTPDHYEVDKQTLKLIAKKVNVQNISLVKKGAKNVEKKLSIKEGSDQKITNSQVEGLAHIAKNIEKHYYFPQDIEWAIEKGKIFIVQTRPITTLGKKQTQTTVVTNQKPLVIGDPACPGIGIGTVVIVKSVKDISKVKEGSVLVAMATNPDYVPAMKRASAIITERGGRTSHAAIVAREFGIPAVVGAPNAMKVFTNGEILTINGGTGEIYKGSILTKEQTIEESKAKTKTKVMVNLSEPELAERIASQNVDGIGLLRAEFMIAQIGTHPKKLIEDGKQQFFVDKLAEGLTTICRAFYPRPVIYRATDFKTNEYRNLVGGKQYEPIEPNPMLGYRGAFRYIHDKKVFELELAAIKKTRINGFNNLHLMIPFVRTVNEMKLVKERINDFGLRRSPTFKLYMMAEIPANVILLDEFIDVGIDGVSIGSNDLTMLILGVDRDNSEVAMEFDERNKAVMWAIERIVSVCRKRGITSSICGQAPSNFPHLVENLVKWKIDSISVSPDAIDTTRRTVFLEEKHK